MNEQFRGYYLTAYGLAVKHGFTGSEEEWLESLKAAGVEMRHNEETQHLEWKNKEDTEWHPLLDISSIADAVKAARSAEQSAKAASESLERITEEKSAAEALVYNATGKAEEADELFHAAQALSKETLETSEALLEELKQTEIGALAESLGAHSEALGEHLTQEQRNFLNCPVWAQQYIGDGEPQKDIEMKVALPTLVLVFARNKRPVSIEGESKTLVYRFGFGTNYATNRLYSSSGMSIISNKYLRVKQQTEEEASYGSIACLNEKNQEYYVIYCGSRVTDISE